MKKTKKSSTPIQNGKKQSVANVVKALEEMRKEYKTGTPRQLHVISLKLAMLKEMTGYSTMGDVLMELVSLAKILNSQNQEDRGFYPYLSKVFEAWFNEMSANHPTADLHNVWVNDNRNHITDDVKRQRQDELFCQYYDEVNGPQSNLRKVDGNYIFDQDEPLILNLTREWDLHAVEAMVNRFFHFKQLSQQTAEQPVDAVIDTVPEVVTSDLEPAETGPSPADKIFARTIELGLRDSNQNWITDAVNDSMITIWVDIFVDATGLVKNRWSWAGDKWGLKNMAQTRNRIVNERNCEFEGKSIILSIFAEDYPNLVKRYLR